MYRIATHVCLDALASGKRRALPMDRSGPSGGATPPAPPQDSVLWWEPCPGGDPEAAATVGESVRLALVAAQPGLPTTTFVGCRTSATRRPSPATT
ncbi:hypothetical protein OG253_40100 [Streptomyces virginiae]|nr:hypothetical protein OG253_40100 [Streptomyces virginiae]